MSKIRLGIFQPLVPVYRTSVFKKLGEYDDIDLVINAGRSKGSLQTVDTNDSIIIKKSDVKYLNVGKRTLKWQWGQVKSVWLKEYDVVILPWDSGYLTLLPSLLLAKVRGIKTILWGHGFSKRQNELTDKIRNWIGLKANGVLLYDKATASRLIEFGFSERSVFVAPNALDDVTISNAIKPWLDGSKDLLYFQKENQIENTNSIIFVSRLEDENKIDMLIDAFYLISKKIIEVKLILVGDGTNKSDLENMVEKLGLKDKVIFTGSIYSEVEIAPWMLSASVFCYPVNIGLSMIHAINYSLPIVTSDAITEHNPEIVAFEDNINGLFYRDGDINDLAEKLFTIINSEQLKKKLSYGSAVKAKLYTLEKMVIGFREAIEFCIKQPK